MSNLKDQEASTFDARNLSMKQAKCLDDFPTEVLEQIFLQLLPNFQDLLSCSLVSKGFYNSSERVIVDTAVMVLKHGLPRCTEQLAHIVNYGRTYRHFKIVDLEIDMNYNLKVNGGENDAAFPWDKQKFDTNSSAITNNLECNGDKNVSNNTITNSSTINNNSDASNNSTIISKTINTTSAAKNITTTLADFDVDWAHFNVNNILAIAAANGPSFRKLWETIGSHILSLTLQEVSVYESQFAELLKPCNSLTSLTIDRMEGVLMTDKLLNSPAERLSVEPSLRNLSSFTLSCRRYVNDLLLNDLRTVMPKLSALSFYTVDMNFHDRISKRFYPASLAQKHTEYLATFGEALSWIEHSATTLQHLDLSDTKFNTLAMQKLVNVDGLRLRSLYLRDCQELNCETVGALCKAPALLQLSLRELDFNNCELLRSAGIRHMCKALPRLECVNLVNCKSIKLDDVDALCRSHYITHLAIGRIHVTNGDARGTIFPLGQLGYGEEIHNTGFIIDDDDDDGKETKQLLKSNELAASASNASNGTAVIANIHCTWKKKKKYSLKHLDISKQRIISCDILLLLHTRGAALTHLNLTNCGEHYGVNEPFLQIMFGMTPHLTTLLLRGCNNVTDAGLMGRCYHDNSLTHNPFQCDRCIDRSRRNGNESLGIDHSIAWEKLTEVLDEQIEMENEKPQRHCDHKDYKEQQKSQLSLENECLENKTYSQGEPYSICNLKGLQKLDLGGICYLTDHSFSTAFRFKELRWLSLDANHEITSLGIAAVAKNCSSLEYLSLVECYGVDDQGIKSIICHMKRIRNLNLKDCSRLKSESLEALQHCHSLRRLDITNCSRMTEAAVEALSSSRLDLIVVTGHTVYGINPSSKYKLPRFHGNIPPPPPPSRTLLNKIQNIFNRQN